MAEQTNYKEAGEQPPSTVEQQAPTVAEDASPSTTSDQATDMPTANAPEPTDVDPEVDQEATGRKATDPVSKPGKSAEADLGEKPAAKKAAPPKGDKPPAKAAKKEKGPVVEDKPFAEFIQQDYLPALQKALTAQGVQDLDLTFTKQKIPVGGYNQAEDCWQVVGRWQKVGLHQFNIYFPTEDIQGQRAFSCNEGTKPSTLEPFLIDERKVTLDLLIYGVVQRLNGQKWLTRN